MNKDFRLDYSIQNHKKPYEDVLEIIDMNVQVKNLYDAYKGKSNILGTDTMELNPEYQRGIVWTDEQKQNYIKNLFEGRAYIQPTIILYSDDSKPGISWIWEVLDGKQRLTTIFEFIENEFPININGMDVFFDNLIDKDQRFIMYHDVRYKRIMSRHGSKDIDKKYKLMLFLEMNLLGTRMDEAHLKKIESQLEK